MGGYVGALCRGRSRSGERDEQICGIGTRSRRVDPDDGCWSCWLMPWRTTAREDLDDDHATATAWTTRLNGIDGGRLALRFCSGEQLTGAGDVVGASAFGEQAVVADAVQAFGQHVDEEAADELVGGERHALVSIAALDAVILPLEGDAALVAGDRAAVGDGHAVGVARQIGQ